MSNGYNGGGGQTPQARPSPVNFYRDQCCFASRCLVLLACDVLQCTQRTRSVYTATCCVVGCTVYATLHCWTTPDYIVTTTTVISAGCHSLWHLIAALAIQRHSQNWEIYAKWVQVKDMRNELWGGMTTIQCIVYILNRGLGRFIGLLPLTRENMNA